MLFAMHTMYSMLAPPHSPNSDASRTQSRGYSPISPLSTVNSHTTVTDVTIKVGRVRKSHSAPKNQVSTTHPTRTLPGRKAEAIAQSPPVNSHTIPCNGCNRHKSDASRTLVPPTMRDHQTSKALSLAPHAYAHRVCLAILRAPDASVTLRSPRHAHAMMRELREREAVLRTGTTSRGNR